MWCGADAVAAQDAAEGGLADPVAESGEFAVDSPVSCAARKYEVGCDLR
jgi:hypothetical protein